MGELNFLHISDFHVGLSGTSDLWPQIREQFQIDFRAHVKNNGPVDLIIFSGDLTQAGSKIEFELAAAEFQRLWAFFHSLDQDPLLFIVPGNHDLLRPTKDSPLPLAIEQVRRRPGILTSILDDNNSIYRQGILAAFSEYEHFIQQLPKLGVRVAMSKQGSIPGDCSYTLTKADYQIGFIGLNSAWSQLEGGDFYNKIEITPAQIMKSVDIDIVDWIGNNHYNFLVTHHPKEWLSAGARSDFDNEINPLSRFDGHFFGHMHEFVSTSTGFGGNTRKRAYQAPSLFGLETEGDGKTSRRHGYAFYKLDLINQSLTTWPRKASRINAGGWRIHSDELAIEITGETCNTEILPIRTSFIAKKKA